MRLINNGLKAHKRILHDFIRGDSNLSGLSGLKVHHADLINQNDALHLSLFTANGHTEPGVAGKISALGDGRDEYRARLVKCADGKHQRRTTFALLLMTR